MEIKCASCARTHETSDFAGAFEIECECGYSILLPEEMTENANMSDFPQFKGPAVAEEFADNSLKSSFSEIPLAPETAHSEPLLPDAGISLENTPLDDSLINPGMTDPENLPDEMPYDPFEVSQLESPLAENDELEKNQEDFHTEKFEDSTDTPDEVNEEEDSFKKNLASTIQELQIGEYGISQQHQYSLDWTELNDEKNSELYSTIQTFIKSKAWLKNILNNNKIQIEDMKSKKSLERIPELLALEIYLKCLALGGKCNFKKLSE